MLKVFYYMLKCVLKRKSSFEITPSKNTFSKNINQIALIYSSSDSSDSLEEEKSLKLSLICLITFFSIHLRSFKNTCE